MNTPATRVLVRMALFVAAVVALLPLLQAPANPYDEGLVVVGAARVLGGEVPYSDFWSQYGPGQFYALAGLFAVFGKSLLVERAWDVVVRALLALVCFESARRRSSTGPALTAWALALLWLATLGAPGYVVWPALALALTSLLLIAGPGPSAAALFGAGACAGAATVFRHDLGGYVLVAEAAALTWTRARRGGIRGADLAWFGAGGAAVLAPVAGAFLLVVPPALLLDQLVVFPLTVFPHVRGLPYEHFRWARGALPYYLPFVVYAVLLVRALARAATPARPVADTLAPIALGLFGLLAFNQARVRSDPAHVGPFYLTSLIAACWLLPGQVRGRAPRGGMATIAIAGATALAVLLALNPLHGYRDLLRSRAARDRAARATRMIVPAGWPAGLEPDEAAAAERVRAWTAAGDAIYVGLARHDRIFVNDAMFYFLAERRPGTRYHELHPGVADRAGVQREIAADLERSGVRWVVLTDRFEGGYELAHRGFPPGATLLDTTIAARYSEVARVGRYRILRLRSRGSTDAARP